MSGAGACAGAPQASSLRNVTLRQLATTPITQFGEEYLFEGEALPMVRIVADVRKVDTDAVTTTLFVDDGTTQTPVPCCFLTEDLPGAYCVADRGYVCLTATFAPKAQPRDAEEEGAGGYPVTLHGLCVRKVQDPNQVTYHALCVMYERALRGQKPTPETLAAATTAVEAMEAADKAAGASAAGAKAGASDASDASAGADV